METDAGSGHRVDAGGSRHKGLPPGWFLCLAKLLLLRAMGTVEFIDLGNLD